jgi:hypothetical protein
MNRRRLLLKLPCPRCHIQAIERRNHGPASPLCSLRSGIDGPIALSKPVIFRLESLPQEHQPGCPHHTDRKAYPDRVRRPVSDIEPIATVSGTNWNERSSLGGNEEPTHGK